MNNTIINADDFGLAENCSKAIALSFQNELISSTTACANGEYIKEAHDLATKMGFADRIGIHINLTEGTPLTKPIAADPFFCVDGHFHGKINRMQKPTRKQLQVVRNEINAQVKRLLDLGFSITHADSHHHIHTDIFLEDTVKDVLFQYNIFKIRLHRNVGEIPAVKRVIKFLYNAKLHQQGFVTVTKFGSWEDFLSQPNALHANMCEIMVHPDLNADGDIVDRIDIVSGIPMGAKLEGIKALTKGMKPVSYGDI